MMCQHCGCEVGETNSVVMVNEDEEQDVNLCNPCYDEYEDADERSA